MKGCKKMKKAAAVLLAAVISVSSPVVSAKGLSGEDSGVEAFGDKFPSGEDLSDGDLPVGNSEDEIFSGKNTSDGDLPVENSEGGISSGEVRSDGSLPEGTSGDETFSGENRSDEDIGDGTSGDGNPQGGNSPGGEVIEGDGAGEELKDILSAVSGNLAVDVFAAEGNPFSAGDVLELRTKEELLALYGTAYPSLQDLEAAVRSAWREPLAAQYLEMDKTAAADSGARELYESVEESIRTLLLFNLRVVNAQGEEKALPENARICLAVRDALFYKEVLERTDFYNAGRFDGLSMKTDEENSISLNEEEQFVIVSMKSSGNGLYSLVQMDADWRYGTPDGAKPQETDPAETDPKETDPEPFTDGESKDCTCNREKVQELEHGWDCPIFQAAFLESCDCGNGSEDLTEHDFSCSGVEAAFAAVCSSSCGALGAPAVSHSRCEVLNRLHAHLCLCGGIAEEFDSHKEECPYLQYLKKSAEYASGQIADIAFTPSGDVINSVSGWTTKKQTDSLPEGYLPIRWYRGKSSMSALRNADGSASSYWNTGNLIGISGNLTDGFYWWPNRAAASRGTNGALYSKVIWDNGQWYDLKVIIRDFDTEVTFRDGVQKIRPYIGFKDNKAIDFTFFRMGTVALECTILKSGTNTQASKKVRLSFLDIDSSQQLGFKTVNGSVDKKYCFTNSKIYAETGKLVNQGGLSITTAIDEGDDDDYNPCTSVVYDIHSGKFVLTIGCGDYEQKKYVGSDFGDKAEELLALMKKSQNIKTSYFHIAIQSVPVSPNEIPAPVKYVSNDGNTWGSSNTISVPTSVYSYGIEANVPLEAPTNYYSEFSINDTLPIGVDYVNASAKVICMETNEDMSGDFKISAENDVITVSAKKAALKAETFYGFHYRLVFQVQADPSEMKPAYEGNTVRYRMVNQAILTAKHKIDADSTNKKTNKVTTVLEVPRPEPPAPKKGLDGNLSLTTKELSSEEEIIVFSVYQSVPAANTYWPCTDVTMTDTLEDCLEYRALTVYKKSSKESSYTEDTGWKTSAKGQVISAAKAWEREEGVDLRFDIVCGIREGYDLSPYQNDKYYVIPNKAKVKLVWAKGSPLEQEKETNEVTVRLEKPVKHYGIISLTKEIDTEDIVWMQGNPTFTFKAEGTDRSGEKHTYYETVEFTENHVGNGEKTTLTAKLRVLAGTYTVSEEKTVRYKLKKIHSVVNGSVSGNTAVLDVSGSPTASELPTASAVFYNVRTTGEGLTDTALVRNVIVTE